MQSPVDTDNKSPDFDLPMQLIARRLVTFRRCPAQHGFHRIKAFAMHFAGAMLVNELSVQKCAVAFVLGELILRVTLVEVKHDAISRHFSNNGSCCNGRHLGIATDDGSVCFFFARERARAMCE